MLEDAVPPYPTARQAELFDQLTALFLAEGFAHFTLDELARRLRCSKSTLYLLADSRDGLVRAAVVHFFRRAAQHVDGRVEAARGSRNRIEAYLLAVGEALAPASARFMADLAEFAPARELYERNTAIAARRVRELVEATAARGDVNAAFAADVAASTMVRIQQRRVAEATGLDDAGAYRALAALIAGGVGGRRTGVGAR